MQTALLSMFQIPVLAFRPHLGRSVTIDQAATLLGMSRRTVYYRISDGRLSTVRTIGGSQRVLIESLDALRARS